MTYETFVKEMLDQFPALGAQCYAYMDEEEPLPYVAIGCVLIPWLKSRLEAHDMANITKACGFLEVAAAEGKSDSRLDDLIGIEIGEWLPEAPERKLLLSYLGPNTQRTCSYHITRLSD
jgi:hypothetical protein